MTDEKADRTIVCPHCGRRFRLDTQLVNQLESDWEVSARKRIRADVRKQLLPKVQAEAEQRAEERLRTELRDKGEVVTDLKRQVSRLKSEITKLSRNLPSERAQQLGTVRETTLADLLRAHFPEDSISQTPRGRAGADVTQTVFAKPGKKAGSILWEVKRAKNWDPKWIKKLKNDQRQGRHSVGVVVSESRPAGSGAIGELDGVWVCSVDMAVALAAALRDTQVRVSAARGLRAARDDLKGRVYDYVTGRSFSSHVRGMLEPLAEMKNALDTEKRSAQSRWAAREQQIARIVSELVETAAELHELGAAGPALDLPKSALAALPPGADS